MELALARKSLATNTATSCNDTTPRAATSTSYTTLSRSMTPRPITPGAKPIGNTPISKRLKALPQSTGIPSVTQDGKLNCNGYAQTK